MCWISQLYKIHIQHTNKQTRSSSEFYSQTNKLLSTDFKMSLKIESSFKTIQDTVRSSGLHFCLQETPFSCYITVRKSLIHPQAHIPVPSSLGGNSEAELLKSRNIFLEKSNIELNINLYDHLPCINVLYTTWYWQ